MPVIDEPYTVLTSRITMMLLHKVLDYVQMAISTGQREWGVTSLVDWLCMWKTTINNVTATDKHLLFGSKGLLMSTLIMSRLPREHSRERGVSPALFTATVITRYVMFYNYYKLARNVEKQGCRQAFMVVL